jgi:hypothetical protein
MTGERNRNEIDEDRAAVLLGLTRAQLRLLCEQSGVGPEGSDDDSKQRLFTYHELYRLCRRVMRPVG